MGSGMLRYTDGIDKMLLFFGTIGCIGEGMMIPATMFILSDEITSYGQSDSKDSSPSSYDTPNMYALRLVYVAIGVGVAAFIDGICWTRTAERQTSRMRVEYLRSVLRQEVSFFDEQAGSSTTFDVISSISADAYAIQNVIAEKVPICIAQLSMFILCFICGFVLSWRLALASVPLTIIFIIPGVGFGRLMMNLGKKIDDAYGVAGGIAEQAISSIRTVYSCVGENQTLARLNQAFEKCMDLGIQQGLTKGLLLGCMGVVYAAWACQAWTGSLLVTRRGENGGHVFISGLCIFMGGIAAMSALPNISFFAEARAAAIRISATIDRVPLIDLENEGQILDAGIVDVEFKDVSFSYPSRPDTIILEGFNLKVGAGETLGLVGASGCGKSTVISLLERLYDPVKGHILVNRCNIKSLSLKWLRSQMGLVSQEPILFATTIKENIMLGREGASMEIIIKAAYAANAHNFISSLPNGYDTQVGQSGVQLSGGQKQRIAIARAIIRDPRILLLDEATSALDAQSEKIVQETLDQASVGRTTIIIAHRLATVHRADTIAVLQSGRVFESGTHIQLMQINNRGGAYRRMVKMQQTVQDDKSSTYYNSSQGATSIFRYRNMQSPKIVRNMQSTKISFNSSPGIIGSPAISFVGIKPVKNFPANDREDVNLLNTSNASVSNWRLLKMNAPEWKELLLGCFGAAGAGAIQPIFSYCLGSLVSVYFLQENSEIKSETRFYIFIFLCLAVFNFFCSLIQYYDFGFMGEKLTKRVREKVLIKLFTFEIRWFEKDENSSAAICARITTEASKVRSLVGDRMSLLVQAITNASVSYALALIATWRLAIVLIAMQPVLIGVFYTKTTLMKKISQKSRNAQNEGSKLAREAVVHHRTITAFSSQERLLSLFSSAMEGPRKQSKKNSWIVAIGYFCVHFLTTISVVVTFWYGGRLQSQGLLHSENLFQAFFVLMGTARTIAEAGSMSSDLLESSNAISSLFEVIDRKSELEPEDPKGIIVEEMVKGNIEMKNVYFAYPSRPNQMILKGLTLNIDAGKTVALVGRSGSGKSTIIGLIERFYDPLKGSIFIDKCNIKRYNLRNLRSHIALVNQEPTLLAGTILQNIVYGNENATEAEIRKASRLANADEFISSMKDGYETYCGDRGIQLSGGQKQRIALARAILKKSKILLLDEATSALDSISQNIVQEALEKMMVSRTCVVIAHQLSTVRKSDSIAVINNGKVVEQGSHLDLLALGKAGSYYSLTKLQRARERS
ncbi:putative multidrug resistance protein [Apium graveolens]|uniref:putative multidrug resistance protein n=1 Tax=Apium graveolens TaxID=4045 RepID=UPI003D7A3D8C